MGWARVFVKRIRALLILVVRPAVWPVRRELSGALFSGVNVREDQVVCSGRSCDSAM